MKVVILAGGLGTRLAEETEIRPKPLIEIGGKPIIWHIMQGYARQGYNQFVVALGYKGDYIKRYFLDYYRLQCDMTISLKSGDVEMVSSTPEDWMVTLVDTGVNTNTGGRVRRLQQFLGNETFMLTYGDGVCDVAVDDLLAFHRGGGAIATVTAVRPPARFGGLVFEGDFISEFTEKPQVGEGWINGGFMALEPGVFDHLKDDNTSLESDALESIAKLGRLTAYRHEGFWQCMDTLRDKRVLESQWESGNTPWLGK